MKKLIQSFSRTGLRIAWVIIIFVLAGSVHQIHAEQLPGTVISSPGSGSTQETIRIYSWIKFKEKTIQGEMRAEQLRGLYERELKLTVTLTDPDNEDRTRTVSDCKTYDELSADGWFARTTLAMHQQTKLENRCAIIKALEGARSYKQNHFNENPGQWWHDIPTDVIPEPHRQSMFSEAQQQILKSYSGNTLKRFDLIREHRHLIRLELSRFITDLTGDTVTIIDELQVKRMAIADFSGDDVAELLVFINRVPRTEKPDNYRKFFGSIHGVGSGEPVLLEKKSPAGKVEITSIF